MEKIYSFLKANYFSIFSRLIAVYFIWVFHKHVEFPPTELLTFTSTTYLALFIFFLVLSLEVDPNVKTVFSFS